MRTETESALGALGVQSLTSHRAPCKFFEHNLPENTPAWIASHQSSLDVRILVSLAPSRKRKKTLAPSRGGVPPLGDTQSAELTLGDPCLL